jgi:hypothetical protein
LEVLSLRLSDEREHEEAFDVLLAADFIPPETLHTVNIWCCWMNSDQFERFLFQVVPRFANLQHLRFDHDLGEGEQLCRAPFFSHISAAMDRMRSDRSIRISKSLRSINFSSSGGVWMRKDTVELLGMIPFLKTFSTIERVLFGAPTRDDQLQYLPKELIYAMVTNMAGRRFLAVPGVGTSHRNLALWSVLLEEAQKDQRIEKSFPAEKSWYKEYPMWRLQDGIFGLLRENPELIRRPVGNQDAQSSPLRKRPRTS